SRAVELGRQLQQQGVEVFAQDPLLTEDQLKKLGFLPYRDGVDVDVVYWRGKWEERRSTP
ncbi:MAG TPA: hypothetical protein GX517_04960, partial [Alicyclobacillus sp.]|nr:hypothetical protein [Alicyclobacillus sp.]